MSLLTKTSIFLKQTQISKSLNKIQKNEMAIYPSYYLKPVFRKIDQDHLYKSDAISEYINMPVKAPLNDQTSSFSYDPLVRLFTNYVMKGGNKELARSLVEKTFIRIKQIQIKKYHLAKTEEAKNSIDLDPVSILHKAIKNVKPILALEPIKRGAIIYQVPVPIKEIRSTQLALKWFIELARDRARRKEHFCDKISYELIDASMNCGNLVRKKIELHRQCEANRAYAHFRWV